MRRDPLKSFRTNNPAWQQTRDTETVFGCYFHTVSGHHPGFSDNLLQTDSSHYTPGTVNTASMMTTTGSNIRREPFLVSADSVILHEGFSGSSIDDIIDRASITRGSFIYHFDAKPGLAEALM
jgi:hypothetical protein